MSLGDRLAKLEPRERSLLLALMGVVGAIVFLGLPAWMWSSVGAARDENQLIRDYLDRVAESRDKIDQRRAAREAILSRYAVKAPVLATFVEDAAKANGVEVAESQNRPDVPHGKKYVEHVVSVRLRKVGMLGLARMLERIARAQHPTSVSRLNIKPRAGEPDSFDVELMVSSFERKGDAPKKPAADAPADGEAEDEAEEP